MKRFEDARVAAVFNAYPRALRAKLLALRRLIFDTAAGTEGVGALEETLKWGQPSYLTSETKSGSTIRIDSLQGQDAYAVYFNCQTSLVDDFKALYGDRLRFAGNRSIIFDADDPLPAEELRHCIAMALTYHRARGSAADERSFRSLAPREGQHAVRHELHGERREDQAEEPRQHDAAGVAERWSIRSGSEEDQPRRSPS